MPPWPRRAASSQPELADVPSRASALAAAKNSPCALVWLDRTALARFGRSCGDAVGIRSAGTFRDFQIALDLQCPDVVVYDPNLAAANDVLHRSIVLVQGAVGVTTVVLYAEPNDATMLAASLLAGARRVHIIARGARDELVQLRASISFLADRRVGSEILERIRSQMNVLPAAARSALASAFSSPAIIKSARDLANLAGMSDRNLQRALGRAGLPPPKRFADAARVIAAWQALNRSGSRVGEIAHQSLASSSATLWHLTRRVLGTSPRMLRQMDAAELADRLDERLMRTNAPSRNRSDPLEPPRFRHSQ